MFQMGWERLDGCYWDEGFITIAQDGNGYILALFFHSENGTDEGK